MHTLASHTVHSGCGRWACGRSRRGVTCVVWFRIWRGVECIHWHLAHCTLVVVYRVVVGASVAGPVSGWHFF